MQVVLYSNQNKKQYMTSISLEGIKLEQFKHAFSPASLMGNKITFKLDLNLMTMSGVINGFDKYKFWSTKIEDVCSNVQTSDDFNKSFAAKIVVVDIKNLFNVMSLLGDGLSLTFNAELKGHLYDVKSIVISKDSTHIRFACASLNVGEPDMSDEDKQIKLGEFGDTYSFVLSKDNLDKIKRLSSIQTLDTQIDRIAINQKNGKLFISNDVFDKVFDDVSVSTDMPENLFKTSVFGLIDNDSYNVTITSAPNGAKKIMFLSNDRDIQFVSSLLTTVENAEQIDDIEAQFANFSK
jgi:hypothetical protein